MRRLGYRAVDAIVDRLDGLAMSPVGRRATRDEMEQLLRRPTDTDLDAGRLRVVQTITQTGSKVVIGEPKTSRGRRSVALDTATTAVLRDHRRRMLEERLLVGADFLDHGLIFHQPNGRCLRPDAVSGVSFGASLATTSLG